jgi:hypothetical protein
MPTLLVKNDVSEKSTDDLLNLRQATNRLLSKIDKELQKRLEELKAEKKQ